MPAFSYWKPYSSLPYKQRKKDHLGRVAARPPAGQPLERMLAAAACRVAADRRSSHLLYDARSLTLPNSGETIAPVGSQFQVSLWVNM